MDLSKILSISGKSGLYKVVSKTKNGLIVESLSDGKKIPIFIGDRSSTLEDISMFTYTEDVPLKKVILSIFEKENGGPCIDPKESPEKLKAYFETILPDYDKERVFVSDIKKLFNWYNTLLSKDLITKEEPAPDASPEQETQGASA